MANPLGIGAQLGASRVGRLITPDGGFRNPTTVVANLDGNPSILPVLQIANGWWFGVPQGGETGGAYSALGAGGAETTAFPRTGGAYSAGRAGGAVQVAYAQSGGAYSPGRASGRGFGGPAGAPAYVIDQGIASSAAAGTTMDITQAVDVMPGDWLVMTGCSASGTATISGIAIVNGTDPGDLSWTIHDVAGNSTGAFIAYTRCPSGLSGVTFRVSWTGVAFGTRRLGLAEFARIRVASPEVAHAETVAAASDNHPTVAIVAGEAPTMVVASIGFQAATTMTPDLGWTEFHDDNGGSRTSTAIYQQEASTGTFNPGSTAGSSNRWAIAAVDLAGTGAITPQTGGARSALGAGGDADVAQSEAGGAYSALGAGGDSDTAQSETGGARTTASGGGTATTAYAAAAGARSDLGAGAATQTAYAAAGGAYGPLRGGGPATTSGGLPYNEAGGATSQLRGGEISATPIPHGGVGGSGPPIRDTMDGRPRGSQQPDAANFVRDLPRGNPFVRYTLDAGGASLRVGAGATVSVTHRPETEDDADLLALAILLD